jgi:hypothetical protein
MKRMSPVTLLLTALLADAVLAHPARAQQMCSVDTDCTDHGTTCGTYTCDSLSNRCVGATKSAYSSCVTASDCKCKTTCVDAKPGSVNMAATPGSCKDVIGGSGGASPDNGCQCNLPGSPGGAGWEGAIAIGSLGLLLLRVRRASRQS